GNARPRRLERVRQLHRRRSSTVFEAPATAVAGTCRDGHGWCKTLPTRSARTDRPSVCRAALVAWTSLESRPNGGVGTAAQLRTGATGVKPLHERGEPSLGKACGQACDGM